MTRTLDDLLKQVSDNNEALEEWNTKLQDQANGLDGLGQINEDTRLLLERVRDRLEKTLETLNIESSVFTKQEINDLHKELKDIDSNFKIPDVTKLKKQYDEILETAVDEQSEIKEKIVNFEKDLDNSLQQQLDVINKLGKTVVDYQEKIKKLETELQDTKNKVQGVDKVSMTLAITLSSFFTFTAIGIIKWSKIFTPKQKPSSSD
jgi:chromosome segregation ATPase